MKFGIAGMLCLVSIFALGCGGDSEPQTAANYKAEANAICKQGIEEWNALFAKAAGEYKETGALSKEEKMEILATKIILPPLEKMVSEFADLETPSEGGDKVESAIHGFETTLQKGQADHSELATGTLLGPVREDAEKAGLKECGP